MKAPQQELKIMKRLLWPLSFLYIQLVVSVIKCLHMLQPLSSSVTFGSAQEEELNASPGNFRKKFMVRRKNLAPTRHRRVKD